MAQQASRSSVELFTNLYFKNKVVEEEAYVIRVMKNGFSVLIPRWGNYYLFKFVLRARNFLFWHHLQIRYRRLRLF